MLSESATQPETRACETVPTTFSDARRAYQSLVYAFVSRRVKPVEEAEDVTAEVFCDAFRHWKKRRGHPKLWLLGIARRKIADSYRKRRQTSQLRNEDGPTADLLSEFVADYEVRQALQILLQLPDDERDALTMQILEDMPIEDIAEILGRSYKATNSLLQRARNRVRSLAGSDAAGDQQ